MASNTCSDLIIHLDFQPHHLNATHSNISFGIALRNLANKKPSTISSLSEESTLVVQPLSVALPLEATLDPQPGHENIFKDLNKLVKTTSNLIHKESYVDQWTSLREILYYVMSEL